LQPTAPVAFNRATFAPPSAGSTAPGLRVQAKHANRPSTRADFTLANTQSEGIAAPGTARFLFWQCREAALSAVDAWEAVAGNITRWQGNRRRLALRQDAGVDLNAYYDRTSFSFFHQAVSGTTYYSGASTDVVSHEVGHGLLDSIRSDLWDAAFLETGAFHESFGDCMAVLTALSDRDTRVKLLAVTATLKKANFVEATAENLSEAIRRLVPNHNAAEPRHAFPRRPLEWGRRASSGRPRARRRRSSCCPRRPPRRGTRCGRRSGCCAS